MEPVCPGLGDVVAAACLYGCMFYLATLQKTYPGIVLSVKSQHAGRRILNNLSDRIIQLRRDGMLDEKESDMLEQVC